jgi:hypothetical protein
MNHPEERGTDDKYPINGVALHYALRSRTTIA